MKWNIKVQNHFTVMWFPPLDLTKPLNYSCKIVHTTLMYNVQCSSYILPWCDFCSGKVFSPQERDTIFNIYEYWGSTSISTLLSVQYLLLHFTMVSASLTPRIRLANWKLKVCHRKVPEANSLSTGYLPFCVIIAALGITEVKSRISNEKILSKSSRMLPFRFLGGKKVTDDNENKRGGRIRCIFHKTSILHLLLFLLLLLLLFLLLHSSQKDLSPDQLQKSPKREINLRKENILKAALSSYQILHLTSLLLQESPKICRM